MSSVTKHYCDICGKEVFPMMQIQGPFSEDGYSTGFRVEITGKRHNPLDGCTDCKVAMMKRYLEAMHD